MKRKILESLKKNKGIFISGEELSKKIGVTRTAVWKHVKQLKEEGYEIVSVSRKGYRLMKEPDTLDANALEIDINSKWFGKKIHHFDSIDSTNNIAKKMAAEGVTEGTIIIAEEQMGGRGRFGRNWTSPKGTGIWMSMILRPDIGPMEATKITQITAAAVAVAIEKVTGCNVGIKWPNDIIINNKKVSGILTEMSAELNCVNYIIVGMGINVNTDPLDFPEEIKGIATSIKACVGENVYRRHIVKEILYKFEELYKDFIEYRDIKKSIDICKKYSVTLGKQVKIRTRDRERIVDAVDLTEDGQLLIKNELGEIEKILSGEVSVRGVAGYI